MLPLSIILTLIHIEQNCADLGTLFQKNTNTTGWKMYEVIHGSHFLQCGVWCSQSVRCHSFSMDPALLTCHLYSNDQVDSPQLMTEPRHPPAWETMMSYNNKPGSPKLELKNIRPQCVNRVKNVALNKTTKQSTTYRSGYDVHGDSYRAVDGNRTTKYQKGSCSHTSLVVRSTEWWSVDLGTVYDIQKIQIWNRKQLSARLSGFTVYVGNRSLADINYKKCLYHSGSFRGMKTLSCDQWSSGQFVKIELSNGQPLTLCEVEVYPRLCDSE